MLMAGLVHFQEYRNEVNEIKTMYWLILFFGLNEYPTECPKS